MSIETKTVRSTVIDGAAADARLAIGLARQEIVDRGAVDGVALGSRRHGCGEEKDEKTTEKKHLWISYWKKLSYCLEDSLRLPRKRNMDGEGSQNKRADKPHIITASPILRPLPFPSSNGSRFRVDSLPWPKHVGRQLRRDCDP